MLNLPIPVLIVSRRRDLWRREEEARVGLRRHRRRRRGSGVRGRRRRGDGDGEAELRPVATGGAPDMVVVHLAGGAAALSLRRKKRQSDKSFRKRYCWIYY